ncbi:MAG: DUF6056 family protein [Bacteroidales bacterium]
MSAKYLTNNKILLFDIILVLLSLFAIIPFIYLARYNVPGASDDLFHGFYFIDKSYFEGITSWYKSGYNGRYANAIFMQIPGRPFLNFGFGKVFPVITFLLFFLSLTYLLRMLTKHLSWRRTLLYVTMAFTFYLAYCPKINQFYWYSGLTVYVLPAIFYFLLLGILIRRFNEKQNIFSLLAVFILLFFIVGSNENWMFISVITIFAFFIISFIKKEKIKRTSWLILIFVIGFSLLMVLAPGTKHRIEAEGKALNNAALFPSLSYAFFHIGEYLKEWFFSSWFIFVVAFIFILPKKNKMPASSVEKLNFPVGSFLFIFIIYLSIFIIFYSLGHFHPLRLRGMLPGFFVSTLLLLYLLYWLTKHPLFDKIKKNIPVTAIYTIVVFGFIMGISQSNNIKNVYDDIISGNAKKQAQQSKWLIDHIKNSPKDSLHIPNIDTKTKTLYSFSIDQKPKGWFHWMSSTYFNKTYLVEDKSQSLEEYMKVYKEEN